MPAVLYLPSTFQDGFETISAAIWTRIGTNPGSTAAELVTALGYTLEQINSVIETMCQQFIMIRKENATGVACYWRASQFETAITTHIAAARTWISTHSGNTVEDLATSLGVAYGLAKGIAEALQAEISCKIFYT